MRKLGESGRKVVLPDGTVEYHYKDCVKRYRPVPDAERKYRRHKPDHPDAVRYRDKWFLPLPLLPEEQRVMPVTRQYGRHVVRQQEAAARRASAQQDRSD